jgi:predicted HTH transcriptional regulator
MNGDAGKLEYKMLPKSDLYREAISVANKNDGTILLGITDYGLIILHP